MPNQTKADAFERVQQAKTGSLVRPSEEYLLAMITHTQQWTDELRAELRKVYETKEAAQKASET